MTSTFWLGEGGGGGSTGSERVNNVLGGVNNAATDVARFLLAFLSSFLFPFFSSISFATHSGWRLYVHEALESSLGLSIDFIVTVVALYANDMAHMFYFAPNVFSNTAIVLFVCLILFVVVMALTAFSDPRYPLSFFSWLDLLGTLSLVPDIPFLIPGNDDHFSQLSVARAGRVARTSTRATKMIRIVRMVRLVKLVKMFKFIRQGFQGGEEPNAKYNKRATIARARGGGGGGGSSSSVGGGSDHDDMTPSMVGQKLADLVSNKVVTLVIVLLFALPFLEYTEDFNYRGATLSMLQAAYNNGNRTLLSQQIEDLRTVDTGFAVAEFRNSSGGELDR